MNKLDFCGVLRLKKRLLVVACFLFMTGFLFGQNGYNTTTGARGLGMAEAGLGFRDVDAAFNNQAGLAYLTGVSAIAAAERRFGLAELSTYAAAAALPTKAGVFGLHVQYFGFSDFNQQKAGLMYARKLSSKVSIGAQISYLGTRINQYGNAGLLTGEVGLQAEVAKNIIASAHLLSPFQQEITEGETLPTVLRLGLTWQASDKVSLTAQADKDVDFPAVFRAGIDYRVSKLLALRTGVATNPTKVSFGFGIELENGLRIDAGTAWHQQLGLVPGFGVGYGLVK